MTAAIHLLWVDAAHAPRIRRASTFREIVGSATGQAPSLPNQGLEAEDRLAAMMITTSADDRMAQASKAVESATRQDGKFVPPLLALTGELELLFTKGDLLRATITTALPFRATDRALESALDAAQKVVDSSAIIADGLADEYIERIRAALRRTPKDQSAEHVELGARRALREKKLVARCMFLGKEHVRARLRSRGGRDFLPVYFPASSAAHFPVFDQISARVIVEAYPNAEETETSSVILRGLALAREIDAARLA